MYGYLSILITHTWQQNHSDIDRKDPIQCMDGIVFGSIFILSCNKGTVS